MGCWRISLGDVLCLAEYFSQSVFASVQPYSVAAMAEAQRLSLSRIWPITFEVMQLDSVSKARRQRSNGFVHLLSSAVAGDCPWAVAAANAGAYRAKPFYPAKGGFSGIAQAIIQPPQYPRCPAFELLVHLLQIQPPTSFSSIAAAALIMKSWRRESMTSAAKIKGFS